MMMPEISVKIKNLPQIRAAFRKAPILMTRELNQAIQRSIFEIQRESMIHTPVDTGRLRASHRTRFRNLYGEVGPTAYYSVYVHHGTRYMRARPFLFNAVQTKESKIQDLFTNAVKKVMNTLGRESR